MHARTIALALMLMLSTLSAVLVPEPTAVLEDAVAPQLAGNTVDCGTNASNVSFEVEAYQPVWNRHDTVSAFLDTYCGVWWETYRVDWLLVSQDNSSVIDSGQSMFTTNNSSVTHMVAPATDHFNEVDVHFPYMETGNYSISGEFYVLVNTAWTWLANVSNTFQVNGTNTTTACGYNDTLVSMETDVSSNYYIEGASAYPWSDIECPVLGTPYAFSWELYNQNTSSVFQSGWENFTAMWQNVHLFADGSGIYHDINLAIHNLTEGVYTLSTMLTLANGSYVDSANLTFQVWANNSGGGNQTNTGCGYDSIHTAVFAYSWQTIFSVGEAFESTVNSYCNLLNSTTMVEWTVSYASNSTIVDQNNHSWTVTTTGHTFSVNSSGYEIGNYMFLAKLSVWNTTAQGWDFITDNTYNFSYVAANTNISNGAIDIDTNGYLYSPGDSVEATFESSNLVLGELYHVEWRLVDQNQNLSDNGSWDWMAFSTTNTDNLTYTADGAPIGTGSYCFIGILFHVNSSTWNLTWIAEDDTCFVVSNTTGEGGNGSNNTDCGALWNNTYHITSVDSPLYGPTELVEIVLNILCVTPGENYTLEWFLSFDGNATLMATGGQSWTGVQANVSGTGNYTIPSGPSALGNYTLISNLYHTNTSTLLDSNTVTFTVTNGTNSTTNTTVGWGMNTNAWSSCINDLLFVNLTFNDPANLTGGSFSVYFDILDNNGTNLSSTTVTVSMSSTGVGNYSFSLDLASAGLTHGTYTLRFTSEHTDPYTLSFVYGCTGCGYESTFTTNQFTEVWWQSYVTNTNGSSEAMELIETDVVFIGQPISWQTSVDCALFDTDYLVNMTFTDETGAILETFESIESPGPAPASGGGNWWNTRIKGTGQIDTLGLPAGDYCIELTVMVEPYGTSDVIVSHNECFTVMSFDDWDGCGTNISFFDHTQTFSGNPFVQQGLVFTEDSRIWIQNFYDCLVLGQSYNIHIVVSNESGEFKTFDNNYTISPNIISQIVWSTLVSWSEDIVAGTYCSEVTIHHTDNTFTQMIEEVYSTEDCFAVVNAGNGNWWDNQGNDTGSPNNPIMPDVNCTELNNTLGNLSGLNAGWNMTDCESGSGFWFDVIVNGSNVTWYDPIYAVGYNYEVMVGPNVGSIIVPPGYGDDKFDLYLWENGAYVLVASDLDALTQYWFTDDGGISNSPIENEGVRKFSIRGLELSAQLDPEDDNAFVTGMSFVQNPNEQASLVMKMTPLTESDEDDDGIADDEDNCVNTANPDQADDNNNGVGDVCDETSPNYEPPTDATEDGGGGMTVLAVLILMVLGFVAVAFFRKK